MLIHHLLMIICAVRCLHVLRKVRDVVQWAGNIYTNTSLNKDSTPGLTVYNQPGSPSSGVDLRLSGFRAYRLTAEPIM